MSNPDTVTHIGMIGLGRMGANLARRISRAGIQVVVYDVDDTVATALEIGRAHV